MSPFRVYTLLEHDGNPTAAAAELARQGYGEAPDYGVDLSGLSVGGSNDGVGTSTCGATGQAVDESEQGWQVVRADDLPAAQQDHDECNLSFPEELYRVPGFVGDVLDYNLSNASTPQPQFALWSAISLQATLAARRVTDRFGGATCFYVMCLGHSTTGKDTGRTVIKKILQAAGLRSSLARYSKFKSSAGLLKALEVSPSNLFLWDEFGTVFQAMTNRKAGNHWMNEALDTMTELYTTAGDDYEPSSYGDGRGKVIPNVCPNMCCSGTPEQFWDSLTASTIQTGFVGRLVTVIGDKRRGKTIKPLPAVPEPIVESASWWSTIPGNLPPDDPASRLVIPTSCEAIEVFDSFNGHWIDECDEDETWAPIWGRANIKATRLAMIYACSRGVGDVERLTIDVEAMTWACRLAEYTTRVLIAHCKSEVSESQFHRDIRKTYDRIESFGRKGVSEARLNNFAPMSGLKPREQAEVIEALIKSGKVGRTVNRSGRPQYCASHFISP